MWPLLIVRIVMAYVRLASAAFETIEAEVLLKVRMFSMVLLGGPRRLIGHIRPAYVVSEAIVAEVVLEVRMFCMASGARRGRVCVGERRAKNSLPPEALQQGRQRIPSFI